MHTIGNGVFDQDDEDDVDYYDGDGDGDVQNFTLKNSSLNGFLINILINLFYIPKILSR